MYYVLSKITTVSEVTNGTSLVWTLETIPKKPNTSPFTNQKFQDLSRR